MAYANPLFKKWTREQFKATVISNIWPGVTFFTFIALLVSLISKLDHDIHIPNGLLSVLGTILALVISFRTLSAYERYQEGRKMWSNIVVACRDLATLIWVDAPTRKLSNPIKEDAKRRMINLIMAFAVSLKHFLRGEPGVKYQDLYHLVNFLPKYAYLKDQIKEEGDIIVSEGIEEQTRPSPISSTPPPVLILSTAGPSMPQPALLTSSPNRSVQQSPTPDLENGGSAAHHHRHPQSHHHHHERSLLQPAQMQPQRTIYDHMPILKLFRWAYRRVSKPRVQSLGDAAKKILKKDPPVVVATTIPLEMILILSRWVSSCACIALQSNGIHLMNECGLDPTIAVDMRRNLSLMQDAMSNLGRIRDTPLPFAYQAHLRMSLWLYLLFLPFQLDASFGYLTIPATAFTSFLLLGFLEIGQEIENPFNYDSNDLDLDLFCATLAEELREIMAFKSSELESNIFTASAPATIDRLDPGMEKYMKSARHSRSSLLS